MKWLKTNYIDIETGEILNKNIKEKAHIEVIETKTTEKKIRNEKYKQEIKIIKIKEWKPTQLSLW